MKLRAIVIEDDDSCRKLLAMILKQRGYEVICLSEPTGCPLYTDPHAECPHEDSCGDFLLTDNQMPKMTGLEFIEAQCRRGCKGVVHNKAILSGAWSAEGLKKAEALGCKVFSKPYRMKDIHDWLDEQEKKIPPDRKLCVIDDEG